MGLGILPALDGQPLPEAGIGRQPPDRLGQGTGIFRRRQQPRLGLIGDPAQFRASARWWR